MKRLSTAIAALGLSACIQGEPVNDRDLWHDKVDRAEDFYLGDSDDIIHPIDLFGLADAKWDKRGKVRDVNWAEEICDAADLLHKKITKGQLWIGDAEWCESIQESGHVAASHPVNGKLALCVPEIRESTSSTSSLIMHEAFHFLHGGQHACSERIDAQWDNYTEAAAFCGDYATIGQSFGDVAHALNRRVRIGTLDSICDGNTPILCEEMQGLGISTKDVMDILN
jgi:hypothetical protein